VPLIDRLPHAGCSSSTVGTVTDDRLEALAFLLQPVLRSFRFAPRTTQRSAAPSQLGGKRPPRSWWVARYPKRKIRDTPTRWPRINKSTTRPVWRSQSDAGLDRKNRCSGRPTPTCSVGSPIQSRVSEFPGDQKRFATCWRAPRRKSLSHVGPDQQILMADTVAVIPDSTPKCFGIIFRRRV
jgi:hypothetical protein